MVAGGVGLAPFATLAEALHAPPTVNALRVTSIGEPVALAQLTTLYLQAYDNQPGISIPFHRMFERFSRL